nr:adenine nucleotide alpha hydrolases-like superfamily protein [Tanacetum cinerariifolium]
VTTVTTLIIVYSKPTATSLNFHIPGIDISSHVDKDLKNIANRVMEKANELCVSKSVNDATIETVEGDARNVLCDAVERHHATMLVVGSHGYGAIKRAVLGSVSDYVAHHAHCTVMVFKSPGAEVKSGYKDHLDLCLSGISLKGLCVVVRLFCLVLILSRSSVDLINNLDAGNPLYLQNNDNSSLAIVSVKLVGAENYKTWATAMKIASKGKNKMGFIDGWILGSLSQELYVSQVYSEIASEREFDILTILPACVCEGRSACTCDAKSSSTKHTQLIRLMQFLIGVNDVYQPIRSTILAKDPLHNVKDAFDVVSREESHRVLHPGSSSTSKVQPTAFIAKTNNNTNNFNRKVNNKRFNANSEVNQYVPGTFSSIYSSFTDEHMVKLLSLINEKPTPAANMSHIESRFSNSNVSFKLPKFYNNNDFINMNFKKFFYAKNKTDMYHVTLGWIINSGANQHMTDSTKDMFNVVDVSSLMLTVSHSNGTLAKIFAIGSIRLTSGVVLFDVLVVHEYSVSLLSVNKMIKDSKFFVGFDEHKCYIQDLNLDKLVVKDNVILHTREVRLSLERVWRLDEH